MLTSLKRDRLSRAAVGRSILGGVAAALLLAGFGGPVTGFLAASPALAQDRHDDRNRDHATATIAVPITVRGRSTRRRRWWLRCRDRRRS